MTRRRVLISGLAGLGMLAGAAYVAIPGKHRALTPALFEVSALGDHLYTDAPDRAEEFRTMVGAARKTVEGILGPFDTWPNRIIVCTGDPCAATFALKTRGLTLGKNVVFIGPKGVNEMILTHELAHINLHAQMGLRDVWNQRLPSWFDEGLASLISHDDRLTVYTPKDAMWITKAHTFRDWNALHGQYDWPDTYGAAKSLVAHIVDTLGPEGMRRLVRLALDTGDFDAALSDLMGPDWP